MSIVGEWISNVREHLFTSEKPPETNDLPFAGLPASLKDVAHGVHRDGLTYLAAEKLESLLKLAQEMEDRGEPGTFSEAGCALGGSAIALAATKSRERPLLVYDVFGMIPPPGEFDGPDVHNRYETISSGQSTGINGNRYYGYENDLHGQVKNAFARFGYPTADNAVRLIKGLVEETLTDTRPVCLAHIDVDWYDPVMVCLERTVPRLTAGGVIILDDYHDWSGCRRATDDFFGRAGRERFTFDESAGHLVIRRAA